MGDGGWGRGGWAKLVFLLFGRVRVCFLSVWAGVVFCRLGGMAFFFGCLGGGREFTHLQVCLKRPNSKTKARVPDGLWMLRRYGG